MVITHLISKHQLPIRVFVLKTGQLHPETLQPKKFQPKQNQKYRFALSVVLGKAGRTIAQNAEQSLSKGPYLLPAWLTRWRAT
jgi:3'-phosphoadenosine 5'-phosphosulfate sulfotransferase (PAPS reductase)/FAD synthetase